MSTNLHPIRRFSAFDYTITLTRRSRYFILECPELELKHSGEELRIDHASSEAIGNAVLCLLGKVRSRLTRHELAGENPPLPLSRRRVSPFTRRDLLSTRDAARALGFSASTLRRMVRAGLIHVERTPGGHLRFGIEALSEFLFREQREERERNADQPPFRLAA
jgi:excisionase family DNA binding protein